MAVVSIAKEANFDGYRRSPNSKASLINNKYSHMSTDRFINKITIYLKKNSIAELGSLIGNQPQNNFQKCNPTFPRNFIS